LVNVDGGRATHLRDSALGNASQDLHLAKAEMRVYEAEHKGRIGVVRCFYKRNLVVIPPDRDRSLEWQALLSKDRKAILSRTRPRVTREKRAATDGESH
jgi:hypothetical protein